MHHCVRLPDIPQPVIKADVVMGRRGRRIVKNLPRIFPKAPRWLHSDKNVAVQRSGNEKFSLVVKHVPRRVAPICGELRPHLFRQFREKPRVLLRRQMSVSILDLRRADEAAVIGGVVR